MGLLGTLKSSFFGGLLEFLSNGLVELEKVLNDEGEADEQMKAALVNIILFEPELRGLALRTETSFDDKIVSELVEAAEKILPEGLVEALRGL